MIYINKLHSNKKKAETVSSIAVWEAKKIIVTKEIRAILYRLNYIYKNVNTIFYDV